MEACRRQSDPDPGDMQTVRQSRDRARNEENVSEKSEHRGPREAAKEHDDVPERRLGLLREETNPAFQKTRQVTDQREQIVEQAGVSRGIAEPHRVASHAAQSLAAEN
jgi:hypothetical protein